MAATKILNVLKTVVGSLSGLPPAPPEKNGVVPAASAPSAGLTELVVWNVPSVNRTLLICHAPDADGRNPMNLVSVAVRDNGHFLKNMRLNARRVTDKKFMLEGPCPRWRGRW